MPGQETNAPHQAESEISTGNAVSREAWTPEKDLSEMSATERQDWLRGKGESKSWSESSLSGFETPDAPVDEPKSDESTKSISGDVTRVSKGDRQADHESTESEPSTESERRERHTKAFNELPARMARELSSEYEDAHKAGNIPVSREVGEFIQHVLADAKFPGKIYTHLCKNPQLVRNFHGMSGQSILAIMEDIDQKVAAAPEKRVTKAPPPAREVGGRGSSSGNDEDRAIGQGNFRDFRRAANSKDAARAKSR